VIFTYWLDKYQLWLYLNNQTSTFSIRHRSKGGSDVLLYSREIQIYTDFIDFDYLEEIGREALFNADMGWVLSEALGQGALNDLFECIKELDKVVWK
jgi:hypothetical protein